MIKKEDVYRIGQIGKPHGVKGELSFHFEDDVFDRTDADYLILEVDGILVPFFFEEYRFRTDVTAYIKFCDVDTEVQARELTGSEVFFPRSVAHQDGTCRSWAQLLGFSLINATTGHQIGVIQSIDNTTLNILFELEDGKLIPANEELITDIDGEKRQIFITLPEGLLDL